MEHHTKTSLANLLLYLIIIQSIGEGLINYQAINDKLFQT